MARLFVLASIGCALLATPQTLRAQDAPEIQRLKQENEALRKQVKSLKQELEALKQAVKGPGADKKPVAKPETLVIDLGSGVKMEFVRIKAGEFLMGSPNSDKDTGKGKNSQKRVKITKDFYMSKYPVTQEQYQAVKGKNPSYFCSTHFKKHGRKVDTRRFPVETVGWDEAMAFCAELRGRDKENRLFGLPTEAEFEYALRAGTTTRFFFGDDETALSPYAWYHGNSNDETHEVGTKKPNPWGLYDMNGNVWQWCSDYFGDYQAMPVEDPKGPDRGEFRVLRGNQYGIMKRSDSAALLSQSAIRMFSKASTREDRIGFRVCIHLQK
jgi:formylglycine-generating enzyme required for sulfatase activity